jgi:dihydrofolate synthase/folylpolyglutamate synthase
LRAHGFKVGLYTSPHLERVNERIQIDGAPIADSALASHLRQLVRAVPALETSDPPLTFFEVGTALAFMHFAAQAVDFAVLETGLGGRLDATTVCQPEVTAITSISFDHTELLGDTLTQIAREKAGIMKRGVPVVTCTQSPEAAVTLSQAAEERGAPLVVEPCDYQVASNTDGTLSYHGKRLTLDHLTLGLHGAHQHQNAGIALATLEQLELPELSETHARTGLSETRWPGRLEVLRDRPTVLLDAAHNPAGVDALVAALAARYPGRRRTLVFGALADKDWRVMLERLLPGVHAVHVTSVNNPRATPVDTLAAFARARCPEVFVHHAAADALFAAIGSSAEESLVVATGSLAFVGELRGLAPRVAKWAKAQ